jgi:hypothetical protein
MKRLITPILVFFAISVSCSLASGIGSGSQVKDLLPDPQVGLSSLDNYANSLTISFKGSLNGQAMESVETFAQSAWLGQDALFSTINAIDDTGQPQFIVAGNVGDAHYDQIGHAVPCGVWWGETADVTGGSEFQTTSFLKPVDAAKLVGEESVEEISTKHYSFDGASVGLPEDVEATGDVWIADDGGYVVKYVLRITGADSYFGEGKQGTQTYEYLLSEVNTQPQVVYPEGCEPVLTDVPATEDAAEIIRLPGVLDYFSSSTLDAITSFYIDFFESGGWATVGDFRPESGPASVIFAQQDSGDVAFLSVSPEDGAMSVNVTILEQESDVVSAPESGAAPQPGTAANAAIRVASGLNILLDMDASQPAPSSYHMESTHQAPAWEGGKVVQYVDRMIADVEGVNIHFDDRVTNPNGSVTTSEAYLMGEEQYDVENGKLQPQGVSMTKLAWTLWPLDPVTVLGTGATNAQLTGTETIDGRVAEIYDIAATGPLSAPGGMGLSVTSVDGQVWIDQETGALLKAALDYEVDVKDANGNVKGNAPGRLEILISQVGSTSVILP